MSPIYKQTFNANACEESASGLTLMFMVTITLAAIGMVLIMLRSAMHPYKSVRRNPYLDQDEKISEHDEYKTYLGYMSEFVNIWKGKEGDDSSEPTAAGTWSGSIDESKSEEEKPLSPGISWKDNVFRPASFLLSPSSDNGEVGPHNAKTPRARPSSLMFSPANRASERNYFNLHSPLSSNSSILSPSSQITTDACDEEQPLSPETPAYCWGNTANNRFIGSSPLSLGSNQGRMALSPAPGTIDDEKKPLSPETPDISWIGNELVEHPNVTTPSSVVSKDSIPSLCSGKNVNETDDFVKPDSSEVADSLLAVGLMGAVLGLPAPDSVHKKKKNANLWQDDGENVDEIPSMSLDEDTDTASPESLSVSSPLNSPAMSDEVNNLEGRDDSLLVSPTESERQPPPSWSKNNMGRTPNDKSVTNSFEETRQSPDSSTRRDSPLSQVGSIRTRFTPQLKSQTISNDQDELEQLMTPQDRGDQDIESEERSIPKRFNVLKFGSPDFLSPLRLGAARSYKKIEDKIE